MGTNYYAYVDVCPTCKHPRTEFHIGKSSGGWCFSLQTTDFKCLGDWITFLQQPKVVIKNEYGDTLTVRELLEVIQNRLPLELPPDAETRKCTGGSYDEKVGLFRHTWGGATPTEGTFDLCPYEFS